MIITIIKDIFVCILLVAIIYLATKIRRHTEIIEKREVDQKFFNLLQGIQEGVLILDADTGAINHVNRYMLDMLEISESKLLGNKIWEIAPLASLIKSEDAFRELVASGDSTCEKLEIDVKDRNVIFVNCNHHIFFDGNKRFLLCILRNVTDDVIDETKLMESEARFREVFENAPGGITVTSLDGKFLEVNPFLCSLLGYSENELLQKTVRDITHPDDMDKSSQGMLDLVANKIFSFDQEKRYLKKTGEIVWIVLRASIVFRDKTPLYYIAHMQDITEKKSFESSLQKRNEQLEKINRLLVARELKMIELKKELKKCVSKAHSKTINRKFYADK